MPRQPALFADPALPDGFHYQPELISPDEESRLAAWIATLPLKPFEFHGYFGNRRVATFGFRYDYAEAKVKQAPDIPPILVDLRNGIAKFARRAPEDFIHAMATEYTPGAGIGWHRDRPQFGDVVGVSLLADAKFRLRRKDGERWQRVTQIVQPRSAYLLSGDVRQNWQHSIPPQDKLRYSITFRTLANKT